MASILIAVTTVNYTKTVCRDICKSIQLINYLELKQVCLKKFLAICKCIWHLQVFTDIAPKPSRIVKTVLLYIGCRSSKFCNYWYNFLQSFRSSPSLWKETKTIIGGHNAFKQYIMLYQKRVFHVKCMCITII